MSSTSDTPHQDQVIPQEKWPDIAQARRDRILGMGSLQNNNKKNGKDDTRTKQEKEKQEKRDRSIEKTHPHLAQMSKLLDQQIIHDVPIDLNC